MAGQINGNTGAKLQNEMPQVTEGLRPSVAKNPGTLNRSKIATAFLRNLLSTGSQASRPEAVSLAKRTITKKPADPGKALKALDKGVQHSTEVIKKIKKENPVTPRDKKLHDNRIQDSIKLLKGLKKALLKETEDIRRQHNYEVDSLISVSKIPGNEARYQKVSKLLSTLSENIETLKNMR